MMRRRRRGSNLFILCIKTQGGEKRNGFNRRERKREALSGNMREN
jgi:hypothetical protein